MQQNDKVVLITGGSRRIGHEISRYLHTEGCRIIVHYHHSKSEADQLIQEFNQQRPDSAVALNANLRNISELPTFIAHCMQARDRLDAIINNASTFFPTHVSST